MWLLSARASRPITSLLTITGCQLQNFNSKCVQSGWLSFVFSGAFAELWKASISFVMSVCLSVMEQLDWQCMDYHEIWYLNIFWKAFEKIQVPCNSDKNNQYQGSDKSLARPGRKQATATKLVTFASHSKKKSEVCPSNQVSAAAMTSMLDEKWRTFNCFFQSDRAKDLSAPLY